MGTLEEVQRLGQSIWYDNISRDLLASGEIERLIETGITGLTSNPTIFEKAIAGSSAYDDALTSLALEGLNTKDCYERLAMEDIRAAADLLRPAYDRAGGGDGYACLEVSPSLAHNTEATIAEAERLFASLGRPNTMIKVPATPEGVPAVRQPHRPGHQRERHPHLLAGGPSTGDGGIHIRPGRPVPRGRRRERSSLRGLLLCQPGGYDRGRPAGGARAAGRGREWTPLLARPP